MIAKMTIQPQVADTDLFGAIDYLAVTRWFDRARTPIYQELFPRFQLKPHGLVVVKVTVDYLEEMRVDDRLEARSWTSRIGNKSFDITQELWRTREDGGEEKCAVSVSIFSTINFNYHKSEPLNEHFLNVLRKYSEARSDDNAT